MSNDEITQSAEVFATLLKSVTDFIKRSQRILFPGVAVAIFLGYRHGINPFQGLGQIPSLFLSILVGTMVYYIYRSMVHPCAQFLQRRSAIGIPQHQFHEKVCESRGLEGVIKTSTKFSQACLGVFQDTRLNAFEKANTYAYNSGSHLLYMTATLGLLLILHDLYIIYRFPDLQTVPGVIGTDTVARANNNDSGSAPPETLGSEVKKPEVTEPPSASEEATGYSDNGQPESQTNSGRQSGLNPPRDEPKETNGQDIDGPRLRKPTLNDFAGWTTLLIIGFVGGLSFDRNADYREALALYTNTDDYDKIVVLAAASWTEGTMTLDWKYRLKKMFLPWLLKDTKPKLAKGKIE